MNNDHDKKFGLLKFHLGYGKNYFNSPKGYSRKIINAQTGNNNNNNNNNNNKNNNKIITLININNK